MILGFKTQINSKPTYFVEKIWKGLKENISSELYGKIILDVAPEEMIKPYEVDIEIYEKVKPKLHTVRNDPKDRWQEGNKIDFFINSRKKNMFRFAPILKVQSTQTVLMTYSYGDLIQISIDDRELFGFHDREEFAINDGFDCWKDFFDYFYPIIKASEKEIYTAKLIHWTDLRY